MTEACLSPPFGILQPGTTPTFAGELRQRAALPGGAFERACMRVLIDSGKLHANALSLALGKRLDLTAVESPVPPGRC